MRGVPRWLAVLAVVAIVAMVCAFTVRHAFSPPALLIKISQTELPADGTSTTEISLRSSDGHPLQGVQIVPGDPHRAAIDSLLTDNGAVLATVRAGVVPGVSELKISVPGFAPQPVELALSADWSDSAGDGTPDFLRLHDAADRAAFRRWFTLLAESQYFRDGRLPPEIDDCAALLRYAYREALVEHDSAWARQAALPVPPRGGDVRQYQYPYTPLGADLFRVKSGSFAAADVSNGAFAQFADAGTLWRYNSFLVGRDLGRARPGDLLFFRQDGGHMPFHAMIFLGRSQIESGSQEFVVYHTGPTGKSPGEIKRLSLAQLLEYPDARWRPIASNPAFLGVYRWNILRGGE